jgi:hypothetical protein
MSTYRTNVQPNYLDIIIEQNATFGLTLSLTEDDGVTPVDITGWSFTGSIRQTFDGPVETAFSMSVGNLSQAVVRGFLTADQTWMLSGSVYHYDVIANNPTPSPDETYRLTYGRARIIRGVTEP